MIPRDVELSLIADYLEDPGATLCPPRFAVRVDTLSRSEVARRLIAFTPLPFDQEENRRRFKRFLAGSVFR